MSTRESRLPYTPRRGKTSQLTLLGGFSLQSGHEVARLPMAVQRVVAFVALQAQQPLHRSYIAGRLWLGGSDGDAQTSLRSALWRLKRVSPVPVLNSSRTHIQLAADVEVDVHNQIALARRALDQTSDLEDIRSDELESELLPDWYDDWVTFERERLRQLRLHALETLAVRLAGAGRYGEAVEAALAALRDDQLRESAYGVLIRIFLREGNRAEAARYLERCRHLLQRKLGVDPSPDLLDAIHEARSTETVGGLRL